MKKFSFLLLFFIITAGMGNITGDDGNKLPKVTINYRVNVTDADGYTVSLSQVSIAESIYFSGNIGKGKHTIDFDNIKKTTIREISEKEVEVTVYFKDDQSLKLVVGGNSKLKGKSKYGIYTIPLKDIREIKFLGKE